MTTYATLDGPLVVVTDAAGNVVEGRHVNVLDAENGNLVTDLRDPDTDAPLPGYVTTDAQGRARCLVPDTLSVYWLDPGDGQRWPVSTVDALRNVGTAITQAAAAITAATTAEDDASNALAAATAADTRSAEALADAENAVAAVGATATYLVTAYGAQGDGTADDTAAVQAALDAAHANGGGTVVFPAGLTFAINGVVTYSNIRISAYGATIISGSGSPFVHDYTSADVGTFTGYRVHENVVIEGGIWDMRGQLWASDGTKDHVAFNLNHGQHYLVRDVTIRNIRGFHAVDCQALQHAVIERCRFEGYVQSASTFPREAIQIDHGGETGTDEPCDDITVRDCYAGPSPVAGELGVWGRLVGSHTVSTQGPHTRIRVINCHVNGSLSAAVRPYSWSASMIRGCVLNNTAQAELAGAIEALVKAGVGSNRLAIKDNIINSPTQHGIRVLSDDNGVTRHADLQVTGNVITNPGNSGILLNGVSRFQVQGNEVWSPAVNYCLQLGDTTLASTNTAVAGQVTGNEFWNPTSGRAVRLSGVRGGTIQNNKIGDVTTNAFYCRDCDRTVIVGNDCASNSSAATAGNGLTATTWAVNSESGTTLKLCLAYPAGAVAVFADYTNTTNNPVNTTGSNFVA